MDPGTQWLYAVAFAVPKILYNISSFCNSPDQSLNFTGFNFLQAQLSKLVLYFPSLASTPVLGYADCSNKLSKSLNRIMVKTLHDYFKTIGVLEVSKISRTF